MWRVSYGRLSLFPTKLVMGPQNHPYKKEQWECWTFCSLWCDSSPYRFRGLWPVWGKGGKQEALLLKEVKNLSFRSRFFMALVYCMAIFMLLKSLRNVRLWGLKDFFSMSTYSMRCCILWWSLFEVVVWSNQKVDELKVELSRVKNLKSLTILSLTLIMRWSLDM